MPTRAFGAARRVVFCAVALAAVQSGACSDKVPLGAFRREPSDPNGGGNAGNSGGAGTAGIAGGLSGAGSPGSGGVTTGGSPASAGLAGEAGGGGEAGSAEPSECEAVGAPGPANAAGAEVGVTVPYSEWTFPSTLTSLEWEMFIESELVTDAYFWAHQFEFAGGATGFAGLQLRGGYQAIPPDGLIEVSDMVVFWVSDSPLDAELGDIEYPDARRYLSFERGSEWWTINAKYELETCVRYRLRVAQVATEVTGDIWYGAFVAEAGGGEETFVGRILVPAAWGELRETTSNWSNRVGFSLVDRCDDPEPASAIFFEPTGNNGSLSPTGPENRFEDPTSCASSRFTVFPGAVRQEIGPED